MSSRLPRYAALAAMLPLLCLGFLDWPRAAFARPSIQPASAAGDHALLLRLAARNADLAQKVNSDHAVISVLRGQLAAQQTKIDALSGAAKADARAARPATPPPSSTTYGPFTVSGNEVYLTGYNLHIQSGSGSTSGAVNGYGNLIIGYNESRGSSGADHRTGSHNLVIGSANNYTSYGCIAGSYYNTVSAPYASVVGGRHATASGTYSTVSGGYGGVASGQYASIAGGYVNTASGEYSSVSGGDESTAAGDYSAVSGGRGNYTSGEYCWAGGGYGNEAIVNASSVVGGFFNVAESDFSTALAGYGNYASGEYSSVTGGYDNEASGYYSTVSGGEYNTEPNQYYWKAGAYESH